jgi:putative colanic acid biosynthesis glycosyltransferase WcaI
MRLYWLPRLDQPESNRVEVGSPERDMGYGGFTTEYQLRILLVGMWLPPEGSGARSWNIAKSLNQLGYSVTALTNNPTTSWRIRAENFENVEVLRLPSLKVAYRGVLQRFLIFASFGLACIAAIPLMFTFDVIYCRPPHPFTDLAPIIARLFRRNKIIIDVTDLWPDTLIALEGSTILKAAFIAVGNGIMQAVYHSADAFVTHTASLKRILKPRAGVEPFLLQGVVDTDKFQPMSKDIARKHFNGFPRVDEVNVSKVLLYAGMMGPMQNPLVIARTAKAMSSRKNLLFLLVGEGEEKQAILDFVARNDLANVVVWNPVSSELMPYIINLADACILPLKRDDLGLLKISLPKKMCEYAACGKPIICQGSRSEASDLTVRYNAGVLAETEDEQIIAGTIASLIEDSETLNAMGQQARLMASNEFSYEKNEEILASVITSIVKQR